MRPPGFSSLPGQFASQSETCKLWLPANEEEIAATGDDHCCICPQLAHSGIRSTNIRAISAGDGIAAMSARIADARCLYVGSASTACIASPTDCLLTSGTGSTL